MASGQGARGLGPVSTSEWGRNPTAAPGPNRQVSEMATERHPEAFRQRSIYNANRKLFHVIPHPTAA